MIKMAVFDMAGTSIDENNVVYKTLQQAINEKGFSVSLEQVLAEGAGKEKLHAIKSVLQVYADNRDAAMADDIYQNFTSHLATAYTALDILPQNNALALFSELKKRNIHVILNTGYNTATAQLIIKKVGWTRGVEYDGLVTASDVEKSRPYPDMIWLAMKNFGVTDASEVIKVGDSIIDILEGKNAGCAISVGITTGAHTIEQLQSAKPEFIISNLIELLPLIDES